MAWFFHVKQGVVISLVLILISAPYRAVLGDEQPTVSVTKEDCSRLVIHHPSDDVAYTPGITKRGRKVVPADLNAQPIVLPEVIKIPITVDMFERYTIPANQSNFTADAEIGVVEVHKDGQAYFNGQPLQNDEQRELALKCQKILKNK